MSTKPTIGKIGFDFGDTIIKVERDKRQLFRTEEFWKAEVFPETIECITSIVHLFGPENAFIISKVKSERTKEKSKLWLEKNNFYDQTGLLPESVYFCAERQDKAPIAHRLGITHFVDNRPDVHFHLRGIVSHRFLFNPDWSEYSQEEIQVIESDVKNLVPVASMREVLKYVLAQSIT